MKRLKRLKQGSKSGMTYVELLVAFSLLVLIISVFTPMLLSSYNRIYSAGETVQNTYNMKTSVEEELATRGSVDVIYNLGVRLENITNATKLSFRRAIGKVRDSMGMALESLFYGGNGSIRIVSQKRVNDDQSYQDIVIKATGFTIDDVNINGDPTKTAIGDTENFKGFKYSVGVAIYLPLRSSLNSTEDEVYTTPLTPTNNVYGKSVQLVKYMAVTGANGETTYVESNESGALSAVDGKIALRVKGVDLTDSPVKIVVTYYDENTDMNDDGVTVSSGEKARTATTFMYIDPPTLILGGKTDSHTSYYTSAGIVTSNNTDGTVSNALSVEARKMTGLVIPKAGNTVVKSINWINNDITTGYGNYYVLTGTNGVILRLYAPNNSTGSETAKNATGNSLATYKIKDSGMNKLVYPVYWGGDSSHKFVYSTKEGTSDYGAPGTDREDDRCWTTETGADTGKGKPGIYGTQAKFSYYYNAMRTNFSYLSQNRRNISYILTEWGCALRFAARKRSRGDIDGYQTLWNQNTNEGYGGGWEKIIYTYSYPSSKTFKNEYNDNAIATVAIKSLNTGALKETLNYSGTTGSYMDYSDATQLTVEDAVYLPSLGKMFYIGSAAASSLVTQLDNSHRPEKVNYANKYEDAWAAWGDQTMYCVIGNGDNTGTTIYKASEQDGTSFYDKEKQSVARTSALVLNSGSSSLFLNGYTSGTSSETFTENWYAEHIVNFEDHRQNTVKTGNHTAAVTTHTGTFVRGTERHSTNYVSNGKVWPFKRHRTTDCWCGRQHFVNNDESSWDERLTCSEYFNNALVHVPFSCWCGVDHINPSTQKPRSGDAYAADMQRCACGRYHNPSLQELVDQVQGWKDISWISGNDSQTATKRAKFYNDFFNIDQGADGLPGKACVHYCEDCSDFTKGIIVYHSAYDARALNYQNLYDGNYIPYCKYCQTELNMLVQHFPDSLKVDMFTVDEKGTITAATTTDPDFFTDQQWDEKCYLPCGYSHAVCDDTNCPLHGNQGETYTCNKRHHNYDTECAPLNSVEHHTSFQVAGKSYINATMMTQSSNKIDTTQTTAASSFFVGRNFNNAYFSDVKFSLGYSSNREYVYSNFCYNGKTEQYKSYEKYYFLSHYGESTHKPNYTLWNLNDTGSAANLEITTHDMWNNPNNDYYNVWFPGECYNLTTTATKEGVTVAVGYTVSGSTYQYINSVENNNSSTALGGIFNDGVLSICVGGQDSLENLLYFKDNATFESTYLSETNPNTYCRNSTQTANADFGHFTTYGTHTRRSVQFTAVDLTTITTGTSSNATRNYYAYYGDNTGRVFRSLVATKAGSVRETTDDNGNTSLEFISDNAPVRVGYIADTTFAGNVTPPSRMEEVTVDGQSISKIFSAITNIVADDASVIISGNSTDGTYVVVGVKALNEDGTRNDAKWDWAKVELSGKVANNHVLNINDSVIVDRNYYAVGDYTTDNNSSQKGGFLIGVGLSNLTSYVDAVSANALSSDAITKFNSTVCINKDVGAPLYSIGGRGANG